MSGFACGKYLVLLGLAAATEQDSTVLIQSSVKASSGQPEYAMPTGRAHAWDNAKLDLIKTGQHIDAFLSTFKEGTSTSWKHWLEMKDQSVKGSMPSLAALANRACNIDEPAANATAVFNVDNGALQASTKGMNYRFTKQAGDTDLRSVAHWGSTVTGVDSGDGWVKVGTCYLPKELHGKPVLIAQ
eukprot:CAMPEP_0171232592 /NCGR_PEP_ID=MMETSP0790-20130122/40487_1 /TAXON_ID=2925 /ORGANISM="Alexandrium catenella, Strain OF101" /LENGTH=185 /DNA_ID=CAMNT_0011698831 /DNA_START=64 /DNA_END=621 /DNA_ORIENTATION=-